MMKSNQPTSIGLLCLLALAVTLTKPGLAAGDKRKDTSADPTREKERVELSDEKVGGSSPRHPLSYGWKKGLNEWLLQQIERSEGGTLAAGPAEKAWVYSVERETVQRFPGVTRRSLPGGSYPVGNEVWIQTPQHPFGYGQTPWGVPGGSNTRRCLATRTGNFFTSTCNTTSQ